MSASAQQVFNFGCQLFKLDPDETALCINGISVDANEAGAFVHTFKPNDECFFISCDVDTADRVQGFLYMEGDHVRLKGLSKADLNGQFGTLQELEKSSCNGQGMMHVKLDGSGLLLRVKPLNFVPSSPDIRMLAPRRDFHKTSLRDSSGIGLPSDVMRE